MINPISEHFQTQEVDHEKWRTLTQIAEKLQKGLLDLLWTAQFWQILIIFTQFDIIFLQLCLDENSGFESFWGFSPIQAKIASLSHKSLASANLYASFITAIQNIHLQLKWVFQSDRRVDSSSKIRA